jgi:hypothetical protein
MIPNLVSANLSDTDQAAIIAAINTIREKLPFLISLNSADRRAMAKMGDKTRAFVEKSVEFATYHPEYLPRLFDLEEMRRDVELFTALYPVLMALIHLQELVQDTYTAVGQEAYAAARVIYKSAKANGQGAGLDASIAEMGRRFSQKASKSQSEAKV